MGADTGDRPTSRLGPGTPHPFLRSMGAVAHGIADYVLVIILAIGPTVAGFAGPQATFAYILAATLLVLALLTRFPLGVVKVLPFTTHGAIELLLGLLLLTLPWLANFAQGIHSRSFYVAVAILLLLIWILTDFRGVRDQRKA